MTSASTDPDVTLDDSSSGGFLSWYHHALAIAYSVSAAVSATSMPLDRLALYFVGSLLGAYVVVVVVTVIWRRIAARLR